MAEKCKVCLRKIAGSKCKYCGYICVESLDDYGDSLEFERAAQYKAGLLERITDFSINAYTYKWNSGTSKLDAGRAHVKIADGVKCFNEIAWSQKSFGQNLDEKQQERPVTISYKYGGNKKELNINLKTIKCNDFWKLGVMIHDNMTVSFYLGTTDNYTVSGPFDLELK